MTTVKAPNPPAIEVVESKEADTDLIDDLDETVKPLIVKVTIMGMKGLSIFMLGSLLALTLPAVSQTVTEPLPQPIEAQVDDPKIPAWLGIVGGKLAQGAGYVKDNAKSAAAGMFDEGEKVNRLEQQLANLIAANAQLRREIAEVSIGVNVDHAMATNCAVEVVNYLNSLGEQDNAKEHF